MKITNGFLWNFKDVINFISRFYCPKISLNDTTDFERQRNIINMGSD